MENASKALIIAGAILIAILLISVGLIILNSTNGVVKQSGEANKALEKNTFNSQFTQYCGSKVLGSQVKNLYNFVYSYNASCKEGEEEISINEIEINPSSYYKVEIVKYTDDGYVSKIIVSNVSSPS